MPGKDVKRLGVVLRLLAGGGRHGEETAYRVRAERERGGGKERRGGRWSVREAELGSARAPKGKRAGHACLAALPAWPCSHVKKTVKFDSLLTVSEIQIDSRILVVKLKIHRGPTPTAF